MNGYRATSSPAARRPPEADSNPDGLTDAELARGVRIANAVVHLDKIGMPNRLYKEVVRSINKRDHLGLSQSEVLVVRLLRASREPWNDGPAERPERPATNSSERTHRS